VFNVPSAIPYLDPVPIGETSVCEIYAAAMVRPGEMVVAGPPPLLVGTVRPAIPDLELYAIGVATICNVQALCAAVSSDGTLFEGPELIITASAVTDDDWGAVNVAKNT
jgi:hypothetical protein